MESEKRKWVFRGVSGAIVLVLCGVIWHKQRGLDGAHHHASEEAIAALEAGTVRWKQGDPEGGIRHVDEAIRLDPTYCCAYLERAHIRFDMQDYEASTLR